MDKTRARTWSKTRARTRARARTRHGANFIFHRFRLLQRHLDMVTMFICHRKNNTILGLEIGLGLGIGLGLDKGLGLWSVVTKLSSAGKTQDKARDKTRQNEARDKTKHKIRQDNVRRTTGP